MATKQTGTPATTRIVVPGAHNMVALLGSSDELLRIVERAFAADIHVRGNEITISGEQVEVDLAARLFEELITLLERGDVLTADAVQRSLTMLRQQTEERPADGPVQVSVQPTGRPRARWSSKSCSRAYGRR